MHKLNDLRAQSQQYCYEIPNPSVSDSESLISGTPNPAFCSQGIFGNLLVSNMERFRRRYELLNVFSLVVPSRDAHLHQSRFVTLYEEDLIVGLYIPLHPLPRDLLIIFGIALG